MQKIQKCKNAKMQISTTVWNVKHPNAGQNVQHVCVCVRERERERKSNQIVLLATKLSPSRL